MFKDLNEFEDGEYIVKIPKRIVGFLTQDTRPFEDNFAEMNEYSELSLDGLYEILDIITKQLNSNSKLK